MRKQMNNSEVRSLLDFIKHVKWGKDESLIGFHNLSVHNHLIENVVSLFDIVHNIQFAYILEVLIHCLNQIVNEL